MTVSINRIIQSSDKRVPQLIEILEESFGSTLIRKSEQLKHIIDTEKNHFFNVIEYNNKIAGVLVYWKLMNGVHFIEHIAISSKCRGAKLGQKVLDLLFSKISGLWLLEVENDNSHEGLRSWYSRNGFSVVDKNYIQPAYNYGETTVPLWIMSNQSLTSDLILLYTSLLKYKVYESHYNIIRC